jgi:PD-(D/E)XK nuclease superfamily protein
MTSKSSCSGSLARALSCTKRWGPGLLEGIYTRAVAAELSSLGIKCEIHVAQVISYLKVTRARIGLLMNFNAEYLRSGLRRVIL